MFNFDTTEINIVAITMYLHYPQYFFSGFEQLINKQSASMMQHSRFFLDTWKIRIVKMNVLAKKRITCADCGSAGFLGIALGEIEEISGRFLARIPRPVLFIVIDRQFRKQ